MAYEGGRETYLFERDETLEELGRRHELEQFTTPLARELGRVGLEGNDMIQRALALGFDFHAEDRRTHEPYNYHLARVTLRLLMDLNVDDAATLTAAPLHDIIEDHPLELAELGFEEVPPCDEHIQRRMAHVVLGELFTPRIADIVLEVSNPILPPDSDKVAAYKRHTELLILRGSPEAVALKLADFMDNSEDVPGENPHKRSKLDSKQTSVYGVHAAGLAREDHLVVGDAREQALTALSHRHLRALARLAEMAQSIEETSLRST